LPALTQELRAKPASRSDLRARIAGAVRGTRGTGAWHVRCIEPSVSEARPSSLGLTHAEAAARRRTFGDNALPAPERPRFITRLLRQFRSALIYLLLFALALDLSGWLYEGAHGFPVEALAILAVLALNAGLGVLQEYRSENALDELERLGTPQVWVRRDGALERLPASALVPGDVVRLEAGDRIPADGTALLPEAFRTDESLLTGESLPVDKVDQAELWSGTLVMSGRGELLVTRTGPASTMGRLAGSLAALRTGKTPLEGRIDELGRQLSRYVGALSLLLVALGVAVEGVAHLSAVVMFGVAFAVAVVPESMPAMMTLSLAFGVERMAKKNAVIRRLAAVEALGAITVIASDKTGTLTCNRLIVDQLDSVHDDEALLALALANDADPTRDAGDPLERALVEHATSRGADVSALRAAHPRVSSRPFDGRVRYMRVTVESPSGALRSYVKGAAEVVLERSSLSDAERARWLLRAEQHAKNGFKVLGLATGPADAESGLEFLGLVTLWDAPRPEARAAVRTAQAAGIVVVMLTGDHPETARAIGERVGIVSERTLTGVELDALDDAALAEALASVRVYSRLLPENKLRIVEALQARGEIVAMTGDGLNDAPALKQADVGVAMGGRGSEVAREVADVVLLDDQFSTIVAAIEEGRIIYDNILNFIRFTFSSNVALMLLVLGGVFGSLFLDLRNASGGLLLPLTALQVLWINFLGDGPPALALAADRSLGVMKRRPRRPNERLLDGRTLRFILTDGGFKGAVGLGMLVLLPRLGVSLAGTATAVFLYESVAKLMSAYPARRVGGNAARNPWLHYSVGAGIGLGALGATVLPFQRMLGLAPLEARSLAPLAVAAALTLLSGELVARALRSVPASKCWRPDPAE
jgi:Ca2+-transporting ATPase